MGWHRSRASSNAPINNLRSWSAVVLLALVTCRPIAAQWDAPAGYYAPATGGGTVLKNQLFAIMSNGHIQRQYGDFRYSAAIHDQDPQNPSNILLVYNRNSVPSTWNAGATWNREHVWPQSRQPGSVTNTTKGNLGDPHALRPSTPSVNTARGNKPYGWADTTGSYGSLGSFWFPGEVDRGDVARSLFYSDTRWSSLGISLTAGEPTGYQMGDLPSLIAWHYLDPPDEFERRRNHTIYSQTYNPNYYTNNRNAYVDRPEFVWSVYVDQQNDSSISLRNGIPVGNGGSVLPIDLGTVIVGASAPQTQVVHLDKTGNAGTYYSVTTMGAATSSRIGRYNAFRMGSPDTTTMTVGLNANTSLAGLTSGTVVVDNLDITAQSGPGRGAQDADDLVQLTFRVLDHATPSFASQSVQNTLTYDFGTLLQGSPTATFEFSLYNLLSASGWTAGLDLDHIIPAGSISAFETTLTAFGGSSTLPAGPTGHSFQASMRTDTLGSFMASFTLKFSDEDLPGAAPRTDLLLNLKGSVRRRFVHDPLLVDDSLNSFAIPEPTFPLALFLMVAMLLRRSG